jgi:hypothetical protein
MYARVSCSAELLRPSRMVRSSYTGIAVKSALPPDVRRRLCPAVSSAASPWAMPIGSELINVKCQDEQKGVPLLNPWRPSGGAKPRLTSGGKAA